MPRKAFYRHQAMLISDLMPYSKHHQTPKPMAIDEDEDWVPTSHRSQHNTRRRRKMRIYSESSESSETDTTFTSQVIREAAHPYFTDANALLTSNSHGLSILNKAINFSEYLCIAQSDAGPEAGHGLYMVAKTKDLYLKKGQIVTWFSGKIVFFDKDDLEQIQMRDYTIPLDYSITNSASIIISDPMNFSLFGCGHRVNHSRHPNCRLKFIEGPGGVIGSILALNQDIMIPNGHALELVFDYGHSATTIHGLSDDCFYQPSPKLIAELEPIKSMESMPHDFSDCDVSLSISESDMGKKRIKLERIEYTSAQMNTLLQHALPENSYQIIESSYGGFKIPLAQERAEYYFLEIMPALDEFSWILMYLNRKTNTLFFFDPEGLLLDKIRHHQLNLSGLENLTIQLCHSWFTFSKYKEELQYQKTGAICVELAKNIKQGFVNQGPPIQDLAKTTITCFSGKPVRHMNLQLLDKDCALNTLFVPYPEKKPLVSSELREQALHSILNAQQSILAPQIDPEHFDEPATLEASALIPKRSSPLFFEKKHITEFEAALSYYQETLRLSTEDLSKLFQKTTESEKEQLTILCLRLLWNTDESNLNKLELQVKEILDALEKKEQHDSVLSA